jgi:hypothetical protein
LHAISPQVLPVISLSFTGTSIARKFSRGFTLLSAKENVASNVFGGANLSRFILTYVSVRKDYLIVCVFIVIYAWVFDNDLKITASLRVIYFLFLIIGESIIILPIHVMLWSSTFESHLLIMRPSSPSFDALTSESIT